MRKITLLFAALLACVGVAKAQTQITEVSQLSNDKAYVITPKDAARGVLYAPEGATLVDACGGTYQNASNTNISIDPTSPAQQFAFISYEGKLYLYSIAAKKFVYDSGIPVALTESPIGNHVVVEENEESDYFVIKLGGNDIINVSTGWQSQVGTNAIANYNTVDDGNKFTIVEAADVNLEDVIALFSNTAKVTYKYCVGETLITEQTVEVAKGADYPVADAVPSYVTVTGVPTGKAEQDGTFNLQCALAENFPFSTTEYFGLTLRNGAKWLIGTENGQALTTTGLSIVNVEDADTYSWIVEGTWYEGFYFKNKETGKYLAAPETMGDGEATILIDEKAESAKFNIDMRDSKYYIRQFGVANNCVTDFGGQNNASLKFWNSSANYGDAGSQFVVVSTNAQNLLEAFKNDYSATVGYVGGYDVDVEEIEELTLDDVADFLEDNDKIALTEGKYFIKGTGVGNEASWYLTNDNSNNIKAANLDENKGLGYEHMWLFKTIENESGYKLQSASSEKYVDALVAAAGSTPVASDFNGGAKFTFTDNGAGKFIIKDGNGNVMRTENNGSINHWSVEANESWYLVPVAEVEELYITPMWGLEIFEKGGTLQLSTQVWPENAFDQTVTWSCNSDLNLATIDQNGLVTVSEFGEGEVEVTATAANGVKATATVYVMAIDQSEGAVTRVGLNTTWGRLEDINATIQLEAYAFVADPTEDNPYNEKEVEADFTWISSAPEAVTVVDGLVTVIAPYNGQVKIYAKAPSGVTAQCMLQVDAVNPGDVKFVELEIEDNNLVGFGATAKINAFVNEDATNKTLTWESSNPEILTVDQEGNIKIISTCEDEWITITATAHNGKSGEISIRATAYAEGSVQWVKFEDDLEEKGIILAYYEEGKTYEISAIVDPTATTTETLTWSSNNEKVATVDQNGVVTIKGKGFADITATAESGASATCQVWVKAYKVTGITLDKTEVKLKIDDTYQLAATIEPAVASGEKIEWSSSDKNVATVGYYTGLITAKAKGTAEITGTIQGLTVTITVIVSETTGLDIVEAEVETVIYDLSGRRVEKMEKGIYIVNGKKVLVK